MKTKEELLKIYSAYLPYELIVRQKFGRYSPTKDGVLEIDDLKTFSMHRMFRPHLYSMDMLTKEIEHKGERFIPIVKLFNVPDTIELLAIGYEKKHYYSKFGYDAEIITYKIPSDVGSMDYFTVNKLLEWHFNVFGLDESEFIKKETL